MAFVTAIDHITEDGPDLTEKLTNVSGFLTQDGRRDGWRDGWRDGFVGHIGMWLWDAVHGLPEGPTLFIDLFRFRCWVAVATRDGEQHDRV
jgi:hypothetical protein